MAHADCLMGVDLGTSSCKVAVVNETGRVIAAGQEECPTYSPRPGWVEQDPECWYGACVGAIRRCLAAGAVDPARIAAISVCGAAHSAALLDEADRPIRPVIMWGDARSVPQARWLEERYGDTVFAISFQPVHASWTMAQLLWVHQNEPESWQRLRRILVCKDYIVYRLTGSWQTDGYDAIGTQLWDVRRSRWSAELADMIGLPLSCLPPVQPATSAAGAITSAAAADTGLCPGTLVAVGSGDSVVEAFGAGVVRPGQAIVKLATSGTVSVVTGEAQPGRMVMTYCHVIPGQWFTIAATNFGAAAARWFTETFLRNQHTQGAETMIDELAACVGPGSEGLLFHPYLQGERTPYWDPYLRGDFVGITTRHSAPHFARAVLEGVSYSLRDCLDMLRDMSLPVQTMHILGGGSQSCLWRQIVADVLGMPLHVPAGDAPTYGAALLAGVTAGRFRSIEAAALAALPVENVVHPEAQAQQVYDNLYPIYRRVQQALTEAYHALGTLYISHTAA